LNIVQILIFTYDILDAGTVLVGVQVVVTDNQGVGVADTELPAPVSVPRIYLSGG
jgi:hypothetical protein